MIAGDIHQIRSIIIEMDILMGRESQKYELEY